MSKVDFSALIESLASHMISEDGYYDELKAIGINFDHWPDGRAKQVAKNYEKLYAQDGHDFAAHCLIDEAMKLRVHTEVSFDASVVRAQYRGLHKIYSARELARDLIHESDADKIDILVSKFQTNQTDHVSVLSLAEQLPARLKATSEAFRAGVSVVQVPAFPCLSEAIGGFNPGRVGLLVAKTGFGKTNLSLSLARAASKKGRTLFVNMEMLGEDLADKLIMGGSQIDFNTYKRTDFENPNEAIFNKIQKLTESRLENLLYTDGKALSFEEISAITRKENNKSGGLFMLFIDYDQKIRLQTSRETPEWKALQVAIERLEELAKQLKIFILVMSQSNEDGDPSASKRSAYPASIVLRFYETPEGEAVIEAFKNRFGRQGAKIKVEYKKECASVEEIGFYNPPLAKEKEGKVNLSKIKRVFNES